MMQMDGRKGRRITATVLIMVLLVATMALTACQSSVCSSCGKQFSGAGYYDMLRGKDSSYTLCEECAADYYAPLDHSTFKR